MSTQLPTIDHPTGKTNFTIVTVGDLELAYSYQTVIGFRKPGFGGWVRRENEWGNTTGRHLTYLDAGRPKSGRVDGETFERMLKEASA